MPSVGSVTEASEEGNPKFPASDSPIAWKPFFFWSVGAYLVTAGVAMVAVLRRTHGTLIYVIDDPAIHLSVAQNLVHHGTWGVAPGHFESASSSPVWTMIVAAVLAVVPSARDLVPFALNMAAGLWLLWMLAHNQQILRPSVKRPLHVIATAVSVIVVLYLPQLAFAGMEHTLHAALVVAAVILIRRRADGEADRWPSWLGYALLAVATLTRFETTFVAFGLGVGLLLPCWKRFAAEGRPLAWKTQLREAIYVGLASGVPLVGFAVFNHLMGGGLLPNSVLDKSQLTGVDFVTPFSFHSVVTRLDQDPLVAALGFVGLAYLVFVRPTRNGTTMLAAVLPISVILHATFAQVGWFDRYQNYLIVLGFYAVLQFAREQVEAVRRDPAGSRSIDQSRLAHRVVQGTAVLLAFSVLLAPTKIQTLTQIPRQSQETYEQRYQMARFLSRYYDGKAVATGELGYISMMHTGPITDLLGLGNYEVLKARQRDATGPAYWDALAKRDGFTVVAMYPSTIKMSDVPPNWISVGNWKLSGELLSAYSPWVQFWATTPEAVRPLERNLQAFASDMPAGDELILNKLAEYRADLLSKGN